MLKIHRAAFFSLLLLTGCVSPDPRTEADQTPTLSPSSDMARQWDCVGENQTKEGNTRKDCLPNKADEAERDTVQESKAGQW